MNKGNIRLVPHAQMEFAWESEHDNDGTDTVVPHRGPPRGSVPKATPIGVVLRDPDLVRSITIDHVQQDTRADSTQDPAFGHE